MCDRDPHHSLELARNQGARISRREFLKLSALSASALAFPARTRAWTPIPSFRPRAASQASDAPNVLLIVMDTVRAGSMSLYGYSRPTTPNLLNLQ